MAKRFASFILTFVLLLIFAPGTRVSAALLNDGYELPSAGGMVWDSWEDIEANLRECSPMAFEAELPRYVNLIDIFPPPRNQGRLNSCVGWAVAYALMSQLEESRRGWGLHTDEHLFSPYFVWNQLNDGQNNGTSIISAMRLVTRQGVVPFASFPNEEGCYLIQPTETLRAEALLFRAEQYFTIRGIDSLRRHLAEGSGIVFGHNVLPDFDNLSPENPIFDDASGTSRGSHAVTLIGYCDDKEAFKFINSWGTGWGLGGYGWISYDLVNDTRVSGAIGWAMELSETIPHHENYFIYTITDGEAAISHYVGSGGDVVIPDTLGGAPVTAIGAEVFRNRAALTGVTIPDSVRSIGNNAFRNTSLTDLVIGSGVRTVGSGAFHDNALLESVFIPAGLIMVGTDTFRGCTSLRSITVDENNRDLASIDGVLFNRSLTTLIRFPKGRTGEYIVPDGTVRIGNDAFADSVGLTEVVIPDSVDFVGARAFFGCMALESATIPPGVIGFGSTAFHYRSGGAAIFRLPNLTLYVYGNSNAYIFARINSFPLVVIGEVEPSEPTPGTAIRFHGDFNDDSQITSEDAAILREYLAGHPNAIATNPRIAGNADINNDGAVNIADLTHLRLYLAGHPVPFPIVIIAAPARAGGTVTGSGTYNYGDIVTLIATPDDDFDFIEWRENGVTILGRNSMYSFLATENRVIEAEFSRRIGGGGPLPLVLAAPEPESGGTFIIEGSWGNPQTIPGIGTFGLFYIGAAATVTAVPNYGYDFAGWYEWDGERVSTDSTFSFVVEGDHTFVARFFNRLHPVTG